jgi:TolB-like protein/DNA-binding winged helix-turn-helix (wHTH) protein/Tfp pilus assembly protein PilF
VARFGRFELDVRTGELRKEGRKARLQDQPFQILLLLLQHPGEVVTREVLRERLWPGNTFVDFDQGLNNAIRRLRDALRDSADAPVYVETLPRLGYRFIARVDWLSEAATPAGPPVTAERRSTAANEAPRPDHRRLSLGTIGAAVAILAIIVAVLAWFRVERAPASASGRVMLAVLPFETMGEAVDDYLGDGLTDEMIAQLGALVPDRLGVIARTSAMQYKNAGKSAAEIGRELGVDYLLEGTVRRAADRVRITARLVGVSDQTPRWSQVYETDLLDVLTTQKEVARAVADEMRIQLSPERVTRMSPGRGADALAYELYLRGRHAWNRRTAQGLREAVAHFEQALARSPLFVDAYAGLADAYSLMSVYDDIPPREAFPRAKAAALKALELDPDRGDVHTSLAYIAHRFEWDWVAAERGYTRALELNPSYATAHHWYAEFLIVTGRLDPARAELEIAQQLDPLSPRIALDVSLPDYFAGRYDVAIERARQITKLHPGFAPAWVALRQYCERQGLYDEAIAALRANAAALGLPSEDADSVAAAYRSAGRAGYWRRLIELADRQWPTPQTPAHRANMYAALGDTERAIAWLQRAFAEHDDESVWIAVEPWYEPLRADGRFKDLLARIALPLKASR